MGLMNVKHFFFKNAKVYLGSRDETRGKAAVDEVKKMRAEAKKKVRSALHRFPGLIAFIMTACYAASVRKYRRWRRRDMAASRLQRRQVGPGSRGKITRA
jgi:cytochrome c-type biogenesis protein CcmH/NrfG